jgi:hypothetical protein
VKFALANTLAKLDAEVDLVCEALQIYVAQVAASRSRIDPFSCDTMAIPTVRVLAKGEPIPTDEIPVHCDETIDVADAAAYHDKYKTGQPYIMAALDQAKNGELLRADGDSFLALLEHEFAETIGNPKVNRWVQSNFLDKKTGRVYPLVCPELCDPFQGVWDTMELKDGTLVDRVAWAYPAFFEQDRVQCEQLDSHGAASEPLVILPGGYQIAAVIGRESSVFGRSVNHPGQVAICEHHVTQMPEHIRARKLAPSSRTMRIVASLS